VIILLKVVVLIILFVVVPQAMVSIAVLSVLVTQFLLPIPAGTLALPYHLNKAIIIVIILFKVVVLIILFVVVALVMASLVEFSMFSSATALVMPAGTLAPPYHLNPSLFIVIIFIKVQVLIILFVVVTLAMAFIVVFHLLISVTSQVRPAGLLEPPYHLTYGIIFIKVIIQIILFVVVFRAVGSIVVFSVFIYMQLLVLPVGTVAPPYHLNQYLL